MLGVVLGLGFAPPTEAATPPSAPQLRIEAGMHTAMINRVATDAQGRWAVTASEDKTARVWELASGRLLQVLRPPLGEGNEGKLYAGAISPDGAVVAVGGWDEKNSVYLFERASGRLLRRLSGLPNVINHLAFSPDGQWLAATLGEGGLRVWRWARPEAQALADSDYGSDSYGASFGPAAEGRQQLVSSSFDGKLRLYRWDEARAAGGPLKPTVVQRAPGGQRPHGVALTPDGRQLAVGYDDSTRVDVLEAATLQPLFRPDTGGVTNGNLASVAWSADGRTLAAAGTWDVQGRYPVRLWPEAGRGAPQDVPTAASTVMALVPLPAAAGGGWLLGAGDPAWGRLEPGGRWQPRGAPPVADLRGSAGVRDLLLSEDARALQFGFEPGGGAPHRFELRSRQLQAGPLPQGQPPRTEGLPIADWINNPRPTLGGQALKLQEFETSRSLALLPGAAGFVLGADWSLRRFDAQGAQAWEQPVPGVAWGVNVPQRGPLAGQVVVAAYGDGTLRWHRLSDGQELLAYFAHTDRRRWVLWTPSGYFDASPGGEDLIGWHLNRGAEQAGDFFPASRFRERFYRPDVIDRVLDTLDEAQALQQADEARGRSRPAAGVDLAQALPPVVELLSGAELSTASPQLRVRVKARTAADAPVTGWTLRLDGQLLPEGRGLTRQDAQASSAEREFSVTVPERDSELQVFAQNRHGSSVGAVLRVRWRGAAPAAAAVPAAGGVQGFQIQPKLYVLAVGVAQYQHPGINKLGLAAKDAGDFAAALQRQKGRLYRDVEVRLLTDAQATADAVVDGLDWLQKQVTQHDVGAVFIAGHGVNDPTQGYTFLPANADPDRLRRTGVPMDEFKKTLTRLPGKALFFFDTCHSGNVLGTALARALPNDASGIVNELASADNGVVVFSSSSGRQLSYEDTAWGNGAFTKALVEGLSGKAGQAGYPRITFKMLDLYVSERVKALTQGRQTPVTQAPVADFPVAVGP